jgi:hypothetical protein
MGQISRQRRSKNIALAMRSAKNSGHFRIVAELGTQPLDHNIHRAIASDVLPMRDTGQKPVA